MKNPVLFLIFAIIISGCKQAKVSNKSATIKNEKQTKVDAKWVSLFDGKSFEHWRGYLQDDMPTAWSIEDGAMVFNPEENHGNNIITKMKFTNFILSMEWKISEGGNSGIFWGVNEDNKFPEAYQTGPEIQILDNERHPDAKVKPNTHQSGALYDMVQPMYNVCKPAGEWNSCTLEINHVSNQGKVTLNGTLIVEFPVNGEGWNNLVADSKFKDWEGFGKYQTGYIGLQDHGHKVWFRAIKIKEL